MCHIFSSKLLSYQRVPLLIIDGESLTGQGLSGLASLLREGTAPAGLAPELCEGHQAFQRLGKSSESAMKVWDPPEQAWNNHGKSWKIMENHGTCQKNSRKSGIIIFVYSSDLVVLILGISWDPEDPGRDGKVKP